MGGNGEMVGIEHEMWVVEGCGGVWLKKMGLKWDKNGGTMGEKWDEIPILTVQFPPFFLRSKIFATVPFIKISVPHSPTEILDFLLLTDTHRHGS